MQPCSSKMFSRLNAALVSMEMCLSSTRPKCETEFEGKKKGCELLQPALCPLMLSVASSCRQATTRCLHLLSFTEFLPLVSLLFPLWNSNHTCFHSPDFSLVLHWDGFRLGLPESWLLQTDVFVFLFCSVRHHHSAFVSLSLMFFYPLTTICSPGGFPHFCQL